MKKTSNSLIICGVYIKITRYYFIFTRLAKIKKPDNKYGEGVEQ